MKSLFILLLLLVFVSPTYAGFEGLNSGTSLKIFNQIDCSSSMSCSRVGGKFNLASVPVEANIAAQSEGLNIGRLAIFDYDFAITGGATSTPHTTGVSLPALSVIEKCWFRVETQLVDAGAGTFAVECEDADNILTAADQTGVADGVFLASNITGATSTMVDDIAASCDITYRIAGVPLTAGKVRGYCRYSVHE